MAAQFSENRTSLTRKIEKKNNIRISVFIAFDFGVFIFMIESKKSAGVLTILWLPGICPFEAIVILNKSENIVSISFRKYSHSIDDVLFIRPRWVPSISSHNYSFMNNLIEHKSTSFFTLTRQSPHMKTFVFFRHAECQLQVSLKVFIKFSLKYSIHQLDA